MRNLAYCLLSIAYCLLYQASISQNTIDLPYQNLNLTFQERATDLVSRMTLDEKILQMQYQAPEIKRLGVPAYNWWSECLHGIANTTDVTVFPQAIGMAATFNTALINREAEAISTEARALYNESLKKDSKITPKGLDYWAPNINIFRDPRWGRGQETYGEDPYLTSQIGVAFVKGIQGDDKKYIKIVATPKHYAVHSGPEGARHKMDIKTSKIDLFETYLPAFEATVKKGGAYSIMGAYTRYLGVPCCASNFLLDDILRKKWGFKGYIVSDCGAITDIYQGHQFAPDAASASALAVKAGCDLTCGSEYAALKDAVSKGLITEKEVDISLNRLMLARFKLGMFDPPQVVPFSNFDIKAVDSKENRKLALEVAEQSIVLLKNDKNLLPLDKNKIKNIAVIGPNADAVKVQYGNYSGTPSKAVSILEGIKAKLPAGVNLQYAKGCNLFIPEFTGEPIPSKLFKGGLKAEFFNNMDCEGEPVLVRTDANIDFNWGDKSPDPKINVERFSGRWTGKLVPETTGEYELVVKVNNCFRLYIDNNLVLENWPDQPPAIKRTKFNFTAAQSYDIKLIFFEKMGDAEIHLSWKAPGSVEKFRKELDVKMKEDTESAKKLIKDVDVVVFVGGLSPELEGEEMEVWVDGFNGGDRTTLNLTEVQERFLKEICTFGKPVVLVLMNGSALSINWEKENIPAIVEAWYPGEEGGNAVANVLFGDYNPAGKLPVTFYKSVDDLPAFEDYNMKGRTYRYFNGEALFPFGHGLSYTNFEYSDLKLSKPDINVTENTSVSVTIKNTGNYDGEEVVQLYVKKISKWHFNPIKSLKGFERIYLKKGESKTVKFNIDADDLKYFNVFNDDYSIETVKYEIQLGASSEDIRLKGELKVEI